MYNGQTLQMNLHILFIEESEPSFFNSYVVVRENEEFSLFPWRVLMKNTPLWWQVYTAVKHNRVGVESFGDDEKKDVFKYANLENTFSKDSCCRKQTYTDSVAGFTLIHAKRGAVE